MTTSLRSLPTAAVGFGGALLLGISSAPAADFVFQTGGANDWWVPGNWDLAGIPNSTDDRAIFNNPAGGTTNTHPSPNPPGSTYTVNEMLFDTAGNWAVFNNERDINMQAAAGVARITQNGSGTVTYGSDWLLGSDTVLGGTGTGDVILNGSLVNNAASRMGIFGAGSLTKEGSFTATINATIQNAGGIIVNDGVFELNRPSGFPGAGSTGMFASASTLTVNAGGTLRATSNWVTGDGVTNKIVLNGGAFEVIGSENYMGNFEMTAGSISTSATGIPWRTGFRGSGLIKTNAAATSSTIDGRLAFVGNATGPITTFDVADGAADVDLAVNALIFDHPGFEGAMQLIKTGDGKMTLTNAANSFRGPVRINGGTLSVANLTNGNTPSAIGAALGFSSNLSFDGGTLEYTGPTVGGINRAFTINAGGATIDVTQAATALEWSDNSGAGPITGTGSLTKAGLGTLILEGANTYSGGTVVSDGTLQGNTNTSFGSGTVTLGDANTGTGDISLYASGTADPGNAIVVAPSSAGTVRIGANGTDSLNNIFNGSITLNRNVTFTGDNDRTTFGGVISGNPGSVTIEHSPDLPSGTTGRVTWENNNTFTGDIDIKADAILQVGFGGGSRNQIPTGANVNIDAGGQLWLVFEDEAINGLSGAGTVQFFPGGGLGANRLTVGEGNADASFSGTIQNGSPTAMNLTKTGAGTQELTGTNPYTGDTRVEQGELLISGGGGVTMTSSATVSAGADLTLDDGTLITAGNLDLSAGGTLNLIENGTTDVGTDTLWGAGTIFDDSVAGDSLFTEGDGILSSAAGSILDLNDPGDVFDLDGALDLALGGTIHGFGIFDSYHSAFSFPTGSHNVFEVLLADTTGGITGNFDNWIFGEGVAVGSVADVRRGFDFFVEVQGNQLYLVAAVPEPCRALLLGLGMLTLLARRRR